MVTGTTVNENLKLYNNFVLLVVVLYSNPEERGYGQDTFNIVVILLSSFDSIYK